MVKRETANQSRFRLSARFTATDATSKPAVNRDTTLTTPGQESLPHPASLFGEGWSP